MPPSVDRSLAADERIKQALPWQYPAQVRRMHAMPGNRKRRGTGQGQGSHGPLERRQVRFIASATHLWIGWRLRRLPVAPQTPPQGAPNERFGTPIRQTTIAPGPTQPKPPCLHLGRSDANRPGPRSDPSSLPKAGERAGPGRAAALLGRKFMCRRYKRLSPIP